jgi:uncharacterized membrane protein YdjX (TVP38/TMEM64 family)
LGGRRFVVLALVIAAAAGVLLFPTAHGRLLTLIGSVGELIERRPVVGMIAFVVLAALSAMAAFVSSAVLIPVAVHVWGAVTCAVLLWVGWFLGGVGAYLVGRYLGRPVVQRFVRPGTIARYEGWARSGVALVPILLIQLAVPSDVAGYVFGIVRCRPTVFLVALALAEVPYAIGAVYLGIGFLTRNMSLLLLLGAGGGALSLWALKSLHSRASEAPGHKPAPGATHGAHDTRDHTSR